MDRPVRFDQEMVVDNWLLKIELEGEWEECSYPTQAEALAVFAAVAEDYGYGLSRAVLLRAEPPKVLAAAQSLKYVN